MRVTRSSDLIDDFYLVAKTKNWSRSRAEIFLSLLFDYELDSGIELNYDPEGLIDDFHAKKIENLTEKEKECILASDDEYALLLVQDLDDY